MRKFGETPSIFPAPKHIFANLGKKYQEAAAGTGQHGGARPTFRSDATASQRHHHEARNRWRTVFDPDDDTPCLSPPSLVSCIASVCVFSERHHLSRNARLRRRAAPGRPSGPAGRNGIRPARARANLRRPAARSAPGSAVGRATGGLRRPARTCHRRVPWLRSIQTGHFASRSPVAATARAAAAHPETGLTAEPLRRAVRRPTRQHARERSKPPAMRSGMCCESVKRFCRKACDRTK